MTTGSKYTTKKNRIILAYKPHRQGEFDPYTSILPIGLGYLAAFLKQHGHDARLANFSSFSWHYIEKIFRRLKADVVGISVFTHNRAESMRLAHLAKRANPGCLVVFGGPDATFTHQELFDDCEALDAVIPGEGELPLLDLVDAVQSGDLAGISSIPGIVTRNVPYHPSCRPLDIERLPFPASAMQDAVGVDPRRQSEFIITSRGCPSSCSFCASPLFWGRSLRFRSPRSIVNEIRYLRDRYGLIYFSLRDDTFTADRNRTIDFCRLLLDEEVYILWNCQSRVTAVDNEMLAWMKRAGCECIQFGVESGSTSILRKLGKKITPDEVRHAAAITRENGINLSIYLITGVPGEAEDDLQATLKLISDIRPHDGQVSPLAYYPGTPLFSEAVSRGVVRGDLFRSRSGSAFFVRPDAFSRLSVNRLLQRLTEVADAAAFTDSDFKAQKKRLGFCHATNLLMGELYEQKGDCKRAETEYREIVRRQPCNPWGWVALGELYASLGDMSKAQAAFESVVRLVPRHVPAYRALEDLYSCRGDTGKAMKYGREADRLEGGLE